MDMLYFCMGFFMASGLAYASFLVGRNTGYQDKGAFPPPSPLKDEPKKKPAEVPYGFVDDLSDPSMGNLKAEQQ